MNDLLMKMDAEFWTYAGITYRLTLSRTWNDQLRRILFAGINPSRAGAEIEDPTSRRWNFFTRAWGFGGWDAVNMYPFCSSRPGDCKRWIAEATNAEFGLAMEANARAVQRLCAGAGLIVPCWGAAAAWDRDRADEFELTLLQNSPTEKLHCFGVTADGWPKHPMARGVHRVPDNQMPILYRHGVDA